MGDASLLFAVLAVLYLWECACWIRRGSAACVNWLGKSWRLAHPGEFTGNQQGGFVFVNPLPPLGKILTGNQFPFSPSPQGVLTWVSTSVNPNGRARQSPNFFRFDEVTTVEAQGRKLSINGKLMLKTSTSTFAAHLARQIERLKSLPMEKRAPAIEEIFCHGFDEQVIKKLWSEFQQQVRASRWLANGLFLYLFAFAPAMIGNFGLRTTWLSLLAGVLTLTTATAVFFYRAHKKFFPAADDDRFTHTVTVLLAPATAVRACDILSRPLLEAFHPLALARVFCTDKNFRIYAEKILRDLRQPLQPACPGDDAAWKETESFSRNTLRHAVEKFLNQNKIDPDDLCRAPTPTDETCRTYCPRCLAQFTMAEGMCADCGGLALHPFTGAQDGKIAETHSSAGHS